jgi:hypothetical protein
MTPTASSTPAINLRSFYSPSERAILAHYLGRPDPHPEDLAGIDPTAPVDPDAWNEATGGIVPRAGSFESDDLIVENAVARICLEAVQFRLPQWAAVSGGRVTLGRRHPKRRTRRRLLSRSLLTINWADSGPGFSWPEEYRITCLPGYDTAIITASNDCPDVRGYCDVAIGWFEPTDDEMDGVGRCITDWWSSLKCDGQERWAYLFEPGEVGEARAEAWADEVWGNEDGDEDDEAEDEAAPDDEDDDEDDDEGLVARPAPSSSRPSSLPADVEVLGEVVLPVVPFSLADCTLVQAPTAAQAAAHAAHASAHRTPHESWTHATAADWMLDLLRQYWQHIPVAPERELRTFALECAEGLEALAGEAVLKLLEVVRGRIGGAFTLDQLTALQRSVQPCVSPGGVQGLPRCSPGAAAALAAWHTADRNPYEAAFWSAEFAALHDAFVVVRRAARDWEWPEDRGESWRESWRVAFFNRAHPEVQERALADTRRRQADRLRAILPYPFAAVPRPPA